MADQAVILAGGRGTRLMPLTANIPKPLVPVAGKPFLDWQLEYLRRQGVSKVLLLVSHLAEVIEDHYARHSIAGMTIEFSREPQPMGTGGALVLARAKLSERFWLINGDSFLPIDMRKMADEDRKDRTKVQIATLTDLREVPVPGNIRLRETRVAEYKKGAGAANGFSSVDAGVYRIDRDILPKNSTKPFDLESLWPKLISAREIAAYPITQRFFDIGTLERLQEFEKRVHDYF